MKGFQKKLSFNILIAAGAAVLIFIGTLFVGADINRRIERITSIKADTLFKQKAVASLAALKDQSGKADPYVSFLNNILPPHDSLINFPKDLRAIAIRNNGELEVNFGAETEAAGGKPGSANFEGSLRMSLQNFRNFLRDVERSKYFVDFSDLDITGEQNTYTIRISGSVFFR